MTRATPLVEHLALAWGKSREPLSLTQEQFDARLEKLEGDHPALRISFWRINPEGSWEDGSQQHAFGFRVWDSRAVRSLNEFTRHEPSDDLERGTLFKGILRACQALEGLSAT